MNLLLTLVSIFLFASCVTTPKYWVMGGGYTHPRCDYGQQAPPVKLYNTNEECLASYEYKKIETYFINRGKSLIIKIDSFDASQPDQFYCSFITEHTELKEIQDSTIFESVEICEKSSTLKNFKRTAKSEFIKKRTPIVNNLIKANKNLAKYRKEILNKEIVIGMSAEALIASWGEPEKINISVTSTGRMEQYIYNHSYVYVINGKVKAMQGLR